MQPVMNRSNPADVAILNSNKTTIIQYGKSYKINQTEAHFYCNGAGLAGFTHDLRSCAGHECHQTRKLNQKHC